MSTIKPIFILLIGTLCGLVGCTSADVKKSLTPQSEFTELIGKSTPRWVYVKTQRDAEILTALKAVYDQNQAFQYQQKQDYKIPKIVHCIWLGPKAFPQKSVENMRTWVARHPDWRFVFWTDRQRLPPCQGFEVRLVQDSDFSRLKQYYDTADNWGEKADYLRYEILYREGGVYIDHDANALQAFDRLNCAYDFYGCTEAPHPPIIDMAITVGNGLIGTKPQHPILKGCLDCVEKNWKELEESGRINTVLSSASLVMQRSYIALTRSIMEHVNLEGNCDIVFPASYFFASKYLPSFYSKHFYATAWNDDLQKSLKEKILKNLQNDKVRQFKLIRYCKITIGIQLVLAVCSMLLVVRKYGKN